MKFHKLCLLAAVAALVGAFAIRTATAADVPPTQLAVVNIVNLFASLEEQKAGTDEIDKLDRSIEKERREKEDDLKKRSDALSKEHPMYKPGSPEYKLAQDELLQATMNYKAFMAVSDQRHLMMVRLKTIELYRKINLAIEKYAKANGVAIVFVVDDIDLEASQDMRDIMSKIAMKKIVYAHPNFDITEKMIKNMNAEYNLGKP